MPYFDYAYYHFLGKECEKLIDNYDCGCYTPTECRLEIEIIRSKCADLAAKRGGKDLINELLP